MWPNAVLAYTGNDIFSVFEFLDILMIFPSMCFLSHFWCEYNLWKLQSFRNLLALTFKNFLDFLSTRFMKVFWNILSTCFMKVFWNFHSMFYNRSNWSSLFSWSLWFNDLKTSFFLIMVIIFYESNHNCHN